MEHLKPIAYVVAGLIIYKVLDRLFLGKAIDSMLPANYED
jgi:hypothetical protein